MTAILHLCPPYGDYILCGCVQKTIKYSESYQLGLLHLRSGIMPNNKKRKCYQCTICTNPVTYSQGDDKLEDLQVLAKVKELCDSDADETKVSPFYVCNTCRENVDIAYECIKKCRALMNVQPSSVEDKQLKVSFFNFEPCAINCHESWPRL